MMPPLPEEETVLETGRGSNNNKTKIMEHSTFYISNNANEQHQGSRNQNTGQSVDDLNKLDSVAPTERLTDNQGQHLSPNQQES